LKEDEMSRRWIDPAFFTDEKLGKATIGERLLFAALIANQDDDGRLLAHPGYLRSIAFPYDNFTNEEVKQMRDHLAEVNPNLIVYQNGGDEYIQLKRHYRYQRPRYYHPSKFPAPPGWPFKDEGPDKGTPQPKHSNQAVTEQTPQSDYEVTEKLPQDTQAVTERYTEDRVGRGGVGSDLDLDKGQDIRMPSASVAAECAGAEVRTQNKAKTRLKPRQQEAGILLDMIQQHIGAKLIQRPKLQGLIRHLLVNCPEATPERLFECFKWLKQNDDFCRSRDSPTVISMLPSKYPEWAAGKLPPGKEERHGRTGERRQDTQRDAYDWQETPEPDDTS
jgi:hypothetical protein